MTVDLLQQQALLQDCQALIRTHIKDADEDEKFVIVDGYGFGEVDSENPVNFTLPELHDAFQIIMHVFDYLDETTCQDLAFFELKEKVEDLFFTTEGSQVPNVA